VTCAKKTVLAVIEDDHGLVLSWGSNDCLTPQPTCPREPGEGYEKCRDICHQIGHAEEMAIASLRPEHKHRAAHCRVLGIDRVCDNCQHALWAAGIHSFSAEQLAGR